MPFIYSLHFKLALGMTGFWIMGIVALVWTLDCFVGFYLTLPAGMQRLLAALETRLAHQMGRGCFPDQFRSAPRRRLVAVGDAADLRLVQRLHEFDRTRFTPGSRRPFSTTGRPGPSCPICLGPMRTRASIGAPRFRPASG